MLSLVQQLEAAGLPVRSTSISGGDVSVRYHRELSDDERTSAAVIVASYDHDVYSNNRRITELRDEAYRVALQFADESSGADVHGRAMYLDWSADPNTQAAAKQMIDACRSWFMNVTGAYQTVVVPGIKSGTITSVTAGTYRDLVGDCPHHFTSVLGAMSV